MKCSTPCQRLRLPNQHLSRGLRPRHLIRHAISPDLADSRQEPAPGNTVQGSSNTDDDFLCFAPDFESYPPTGHLRPDWLLVHEAAVPAGQGKADRGGFQMWQQHLTIQGHGLVLVGPANINSVTFWLWRRGLRAHDPFWARPWPSGLALADMIFRHPELVRGKRVLELGAGVGAPGIAAALMGAKQVVITDREPLSLHTAAMSAQASGVPACVSPADMQAVPDGCIICELLDWSQPVPDHLGRFDLVLATDVLYEHHAVPTLAHVVAQLLGDTAAAKAGLYQAGATEGHQQEGAALLLAEYPDRYPSNQRNFRALLQAPPLNLHLDSFSQQVVRLPCFENEMLDVEMDASAPAIKTDFLLFQQH